LRRSHVRSSGGQGLSVLPARRGKREGALLGQSLFCKHRIHPSSPSTTTTRTYQSRLETSYLTTPSENASLSQHTTIQKWFSSTKTPSLYVRLVINTLRHQTNNNTHSSSAKQPVTSTQTVICNPSHAFTPLSPPSAAPALYA
jgi:hypothetical protein